MSWTAIDRTAPAFDIHASPLLSEAVKANIRSFFPRYETKRAALLPALHIVQDAHGHVSYQAMYEVAKLLEMHPSQVIDTISFYTHFWTHHKGEKVITACRSISCEIMGGANVLEELKRRLGIAEHQTTSDGKYSLVTEECLAGCDHAPCLLINEKLHKQVKPGDVAKILADPHNDRITVPRSDLFDAPPEHGRTAADHSNELAEVEAVGVGTTSDVREMQESD